MNQDKSSTTFVNQLNDIGQRIYQEMKSKNTFLYYLRITNTSKGSSEEYPFPNTDKSTRNSIHNNTISQIESTLREHIQDFDDGEIWFEIGDSSELYSERMNLVYSVDFDDITARIVFETRPVN